MSGSSSLMLMGVGKVAAAAFSLADVPNKVALLEPESLAAYANNAAITQWDDTSGAGNHFTQVTGSKQPLCKTNILNGYRVARLDNSDDQLDSSLALSSGGLSVAIVYCTFVQVASHRAVRGSANWLIGPYANKYDLYAGNFASPNSTSVTNGAFVRHIITLNATTATNYVNGVQNGTVASPTYPGTIGLGAGGPFSEPLDGDIAMLIISNSVWSGSVITSLDALLASKFAL